MGRSKKIKSNYDTSFIVRCNSDYLNLFDNYCHSLGVSRNHLLNCILISFVCSLNEDSSNEHPQTDFNYFL